MKLRIIQTIENDDYVYVFNVEDLSSVDLGMADKYGEPEIDFGGSFNNGSGISYTLPTDLRNLPSEFPVRIVVSSASAPFNTNTDVKLALYRTTIEDRVTAAMVALRTTADTFTGEHVTTI